MEIPNLRQTRIELESEPNLNIIRNRYTMGVEFGSNSISIRVRIRVRFDTGSPWIREIIRFDSGSTQIRNFHSMPLRSGYINKEYIKKR